MPGLEVEQSGAVVVGLVLVVDRVDVGIRLPTARAGGRAGQSRSATAQEGVLGLTLCRAVRRRAQARVDDEDPRPAVAVELEPLGAGSEGATAGSAVVISTALFSGVITVSAPIGGADAPVRAPPSTCGIAELAPNTTWLSSARMPLAWKRATAR